jgi:hypothetical protein
MTDFGADEVLHEALTSALTSLVSLMPLHVTLAIHMQPVLTEDEIVWSVPLGTIERGERDGVAFVKLAEDGAEAGPITCEPYGNGRGWYHVRGCKHVDWGQDG